MLGKNYKKLQGYIQADVLEEEFGGHHKMYACPDQFVQPLLEGKVGVIGVKPYEPLRIVEPGDGLAMIDSSSKSIGNEDSSFDQDEDTSSSSLNLSEKKTTAKKKRPNLRGVVAKMFAKNKPPAEYDPEPSSSDKNRPLEKWPSRSRPRIAVFGATGRTGKALALELLDQGVDVSAFVRVHGSNLSPELVQHANSSGDESKPRLTIVVGDFGSLLDLERAVEDTDGVICCIGSSPSLSTTTLEFLPKAVEHIIDAMQRFNVRHLVVVSNACASQSWWDHGAGFLSNLTKPVYWNSHFQYLAQMEAIVQTKGNQGVVDFTIVRPGSLTNDSMSGSVRSEEGFILHGHGPGQIPRLDLAKFLVSQVTDSKTASQHRNKGLAIGMM